jgi:predicted deacylase
MATHDSQRLTLARLPSGISISTTVHTYGGDEAGPTVYIQAAQHGREVNGTAVLRRLHESLLAASVEGTIHTIPVADPLTFDRASYTTPEALDSVNGNMNRVWPGDADGSLHERMAASLWALAGEADAIVDLHTGGRDMATHVVFEEDAPTCRRLAEAFGTDLLLSEPAGEAADEEWHDRDFAGKLRVAARAADIPAITPELAHNQAIVDTAVETGATGVRNVLRELAVLPGEPEPNGEAVLARNHLGRVRAVESGLFHPDPARSVGERVAAGTALGTLYDPTTFEVFQEAVADRDGILYSLNREAIVTAGSTVANVAEPR